MAGEMTSSGGRRRVAAWPDEKDEGQMVFVVVVGVVCYNFSMAESAYAIAGAASTLK
jgi:hypothetical protein